MTRALLGFVLAWGLPVTLLLLASSLLCGSPNVAACFGPIDQPSYDERHDPG